ncbi:MAG TPA: tetratricopeptide repeat protein, partial [Cyclobacteriaceae bacterium]|nr:tetratricopeptide repeat protein [Cyclobacteriaceae bacterium]
MADFTLDWEDDEPISERKHFVDREEFKKILTHGVEDPQTIDERRVLVFYGAGGQGKSALKNDFFIKEYLTGARGTGVVFSDRVDFEDQPKTRWADESLLRIAQDLIDRGSIPLPAFCLGFIRYKILTSPESNLQQEYPFLFKVKFIENDFANEIFNSIISSSLELLVTGSNMVPGVNFFTKKISEASNRKIIEWIQKSDAKKVLGDIDELNSLQLLQRLPLLLAYDINKYLKRSTHPRRIVIIFDGYEALWRDATHYDADKDAWVRTLVEKTPGVLFVMFGREKMQWGEKNEAFNNILHQYLVKGLPDKDADHLLQLSGVAEEDVRGQIILASKVTSAFEDGCLPFFLDLQINTYLKIQKSGRSPVSADFHKYDDDVITHFLEHLHLEVAGAIRALATAPYIDEEIIELFVSNNIILPNAISLMSLRRHSFIRMDGEKAMMHSLMKDLAVKQYASEFKLRFAKVNHLLFQYFDARALTDPRNFTVENGLSLELAARYKALDDRSGYSAWAVDKVKDLVSNEVANRFVTSVLGTAKDIFENDTRQRLGKEEFDARDLTIDEALAYSKTMFYLAKAYDLAGQYRFTLDYSLSCAAFSKMEGERIKEVFSSNDQELKNKLTTFFEIRYNAGLQYACILDTADDNANADKFYRVAEDLRNDILFSANEVPYALFKSKMGRHAEAEPVLFAEYLQLKNDPKASGLKLSTASHNVALCLYRQQRYDEALRYQTESLQVLEAHGEKDSSQYLTSLLLLATVLIETGLDLDHASSIYEHVLRVYRDRYEDDHVNFG